jgi:PTS system mannose-specific IIA component
LIHIIGTKFALETNSRQFWEGGGGDVISILVVTHGNLGRELISTAELIVGKQEQVDALGFFLSDSADELQRKIREKYESLEQGEGVLVLTDIFGGSTSNSVAIALKDKNYQCVTVVNLPVMIEALLSRDEGSLKELSLKCREVGIEGVKDLRAFMELDMPV